VSRATTPNAPALQQLREQLHPCLLPLYPELLTPVEPPTVRDVIDVLEQLEAISYATGISNTAHFAMDVISSLVAMIDLDRLEPGAPRQTFPDMDDVESPL
jgi:hypothetical protein